MASMAEPILDELLEDIFLRLPTAADLARASTACASFRRVIAGHAFLRRFRALHPPPLLGILQLPFLPAQPPHPSAAAARAFADAMPNFSCSSFLPFPDRWRVSDLRDGRALLSGVPEGNAYFRDGYVPSVFLRDFAVCDPLHRRYRLLPVIPDELAMLLHQPDILHFDRFLAPPAAAAAAAVDDDDNNASFRVMCLAQCTTKLVLFVFSPAQQQQQQWHAAAFDGWINLMTEPDNNNNPTAGSQLYFASKRYYAHRCFCWAVRPTNKLLMLDTATMEFSAVNLPPPPGPHMCQMAFVEAPEGKIGMFTLYDGFDGEEDVFVYHLWYTILQNENDGDSVVNQWRSEATIPLPLTYRYSIMGVAGGYLLLLGILEDLNSIPLTEMPECECFSLNLQSFQLELFCGTKHKILQANLYAGFPPSLSAPTM